MIRAAVRELGAQVSGLLVLLIRVYQSVLSPFLGGQCRFEPSCSHYGIACISAHGAVRGSWLTLRRISRCHPFHPGGFDPPPLAVSGPSDRAGPKASPFTSSDSHTAPG